MLLQPKNRKFKKARKGRLRTHISPHSVQKGVKHSSFTLKYGEFGLITEVGARFHSKQIEAGRRTITSSLRRKGRLWIRAFPDTPVTAKPSDARMGKGKGPLSHWVAPLASGQILYEISGVSEEEGLRALKAASKKLPFPTRTITRMSFPSILDPPFPDYPNQYIWI